MTPNPGSGDKTDLFPINVWVYQGVVGTCETLTFWEPVYTGVADFSSCTQDPSHLGVTESIEEPQSGRSSHYYLLWTEYPNIIIYFTKGQYETFSIPKLFESGNTKNNPW